MSNIVTLFNYRRYDVRVYVDCFRPSTYNARTNTNTINTIILNFIH